MPLSSKDFGWLDNYYIWDAITTLAVGGGATQEQIYDIFNGWSPPAQDPAIALFESQSGVFNSLANLLYHNGNSAAEWLNEIDTEINNIHTALSSVRGAILTTTTGSLTINSAVHNISIYNSGSAAGTLAVSGGSAVSVPAGVTINFDAGGNNNRYAAGTFVMNASGTTFIVSYTI